MATETEMTDEQYREAARDEWERDGAIEFDRDAEVSRSDDGAYVQAWVWIAVRAEQ